MARSAGADQDIIRLKANHLYDHFAETLWHTERTIYNTLGVAKLLMSRHVHQAQYKVIITAEGSDGLFGGYPAFRRDMVWFLYGLDTLSTKEQVQWEQKLTENNQLFRGAMLAEDEIHNSALSALIGFTPSCLQPWLHTAQHVPALLSAPIWEQLKNYEPRQAIADYLDAKGTNSDLGRGSGGYG